MKWIQHGMVVIVAGICVIVCAAEEKVENKNVTIVTAESKADGSSNVEREIVEECIVSLPDKNGLVAVTQSESPYLREINGEKGNDRYVKTYTAEIVIHYLVRQKELIIITTSSVTASEPVIKEVTRTLTKSEIVRSDTGDGDMYAGNSPRKYYFSSAGAASDNAKKRALAWIEQHRNVVCPQ